jgi:glutathione peroxidase
MSSPFYEFKVKTLRGKDFNLLEECKGKVILIFNSASACGFTTQLQGFQDLYAKYQSKGLVVLGFPTDDFKQETGTEGQIEEFCQANV